MARCVLTSSMWINTCDLLRGFFYFFYHVIAIEEEKKKRLVHPTAVCQRGEIITRNPSSPEEKEAVVKCVTVGDTR